MTVPFTAETVWYRSTFDNVWLEDVTWAFLSARVSADPDRDETWTMDATLTPEGWAYFDPYLDWVAPVLTATYPDGTVRRGQLGLYQVLDSGEDAEETGGSVDLDARDPLYLLSVQAFERKVVAPAGKGRLRTIREVLDDAVLLDGSDGKPRYVIHGDERPFNRAAEWSRNTTRLDLCNELAEGSGAHQLWTSAAGVILTRDRGKAALRHRQEVRTFLANVPAGVDLGRRSGMAYEDYGRVVGRVRTTPKAQDQTNEVVIVGGVPWEEPRKARHRADHPSNARSDRQSRREDRRREQQQVQDRRQRRRRWIGRHPLLDDDATAQRVARALMDELSTENTVVRFQALPDPQPDYTREVIGLAIWDATRAAPVALGRYAVRSINWDLTNTSAIMTIEAGQVQNADSVVGGAA